MTPSELQFIEEQREYLRTIGQWMTFFSVMMAFVIVAIFIVCTVSISTSEDSLQTTIMSFIWLLNLLSLNPANLMLRAAIVAKKYTENGDIVQMTEFLRLSKRFWRSAGIIVLISIVSVVIIVVSAL